MTRFLSRSHRLVHHCECGVATIFKADPLDPGRGNLYRKEILLPGGSRDEMDSLKVSFLF